MWTPLSRSITRISANACFVSSSRRILSSLIGETGKIEKLRSPTTRDAAAFLEKMNNRVGSVITDATILEPYNTDWTVSILLVGIMYEKNYSFPIKFNDQKELM